MSLKHSVMVVDDEAELRDNLVELLRHEGFLVSAAESGAAGLGLLTTERFDVVLLDLIMPGMDGIETMQEMRKVSGTTKFIFITAFATIGTAVQAIRKGASDYLSKPFRLEDLLTVVRRSLEEYRFEQQIQSCNLDQTLASLANPVRRRIIEMLGRSHALRMTDISIALRFYDHTKTLFHLRTLKDANLIRQAEEKFYVLTDAGKNTLHLLHALTQSGDVK